MIINNIKGLICENIGSKVHILVYGSRNKNEEYYGYIKEAYDKVFIVQLKNDDIKSFSYVDLLTKSVQVVFI